MFLVTSDLAGNIPVDLSLRSPKCGSGPGKRRHPGFRLQLQHDQKQQVCSRHRVHGALRGRCKRCQLFVNFPKHATSESATFGKVLQRADGDCPGQEPKARFFLDNLNAQRTLVTSGVGHQF
jgi:hypothetical protein